MKNLIILKDIIAREFKRISERRTLFLLMIILPVSIAFFFGAIYKNEIARNIPVAVYDADNSELSRTIIRFIESSNYLQVGEYVNSGKEIETGILNGEFEGAFYIPKNFEKDIKKGKHSTIVVYKNTANLVIGNLILKDASTIIRTVSGGILLKKFKNKTLNEEQAMNIVNPVKIESQSLFNPNYSYSQFLVPGLIFVSLQMAIMLSAALVFNSEISHKTFAMLIETGEGSPLLIFTGKMLSHYFIHLLNSIIIVFLILPLFDIIIYGAVFPLFVLISLFIIASLSLAFLISVFINDQLFATEIALVINTPAFMFSGLTFPLWSMPLLHNIFSELIPFTHFLSAYLKLAQMSLPFSFISAEVFKLLLFIILPSIITLFTLRKKINNPEYYSSMLLAETAE